MERDFLGLATNSSSPIIKHEINDAHNDHPVAQRGTGLQWYFPDSVLNSPQVVSSKSCPEKKPMRSIFDPPPSPRSVTASTTDDHSQRNMINKQSGSQITWASFSMEQSDLQPVYRPEGVKLHSFANNQNETTSSPMNYPVLQSHTFPTEQHMGRSTSNSRSFGCIPPVSPASRIPSPSCFPTYSDMRNSSKPLTAPAQMTIFYAGSVIVYDNISPDKAQAIMLLAGDGTSSTPVSVVPSTQSQTPCTKPSTHDIVRIGNPSRTTPSSGLVSHVSIFSHIASQRGGVSNQKILTSSQQQAEASQEIYSQRSSTGYAIPGPVPQARKASLARFLEKRKERVTNSQPYPVELKSSERERNMSSASDGLSFTLRSPSS